jgi:lysophospholipase
MRTIAPVTPDFNRFSGRTMADLTSPPPGMVRGRFERNGREIATLFAPSTSQDEPLGDVVFLPGYGSSVFYHYHAIRELQEAGYNVHAMDWYGQGQSERVDPARPWQPATEDFTEHLADLDAFVTDHVRPVAGDNLMLSAHSMGGHLGLRYIHDNPGVFQRAVLMAPMLNFNTFDLPKSFLHGIVFAGQTLGFGNTAFGGNFIAQPQVCNDNGCAVGRNLYDDSYYALRRQFGDAAARMPSLNWFEQAIESIDVTERRGYLESIQTPILFIRGENDMVIDNDRISDAAERMPNSRVITLKGADHGLLSDDAAIQYGLWQSQLDFLDGTTAPRITGPTRMAHGARPGGVG